MRSNALYDIRNTILLIIIYILFNFSSLAYSQDYNPNDSVDFYNAVKSGLEKYLDKITPDREYLFGFNSRDEFNKIRLGDPLQIIIIRENSFTESNPQEIFIPVNKWEIPLIVDDDYRCFLDIVFSEGEYKAVGIGLHYLASDLDTYEKQKGLKTIKNRALFLDYSLPSYCVVIPNSNKEYEFMPFRPIPKCRSCENDEKEKYTDRELFELLKIKNEELEINNLKDHD